jgi:signal transduction histidine kinase
MLTTSSLVASRLLRGGRPAESALVLAAGTKVPAQVPPVTAAAYDRGVTGSAGDSALVGESAPGEPQDADRVADLLTEVMTLGSDLDLDQVLQRVTAGAARLTGARYAALGVLAPDGSLSAFYTHGMDDDERARVGPLPRGLGVLGVLITDPQPLRMDDLSRHPRSVGFPPHHPPMRTFLGVPVQAGGEVFGNLYLTDKASAFTAEDERLVVLLAAAAGNAIVNARLYSESERRLRWVEASAEVTGTLLARPHAGDALILVVRRARELSDAHSAALAVEDDDGRLVVTVVDGAPVPGFAVNDDVTAGGGAAGDLPVLSVPFTAPAGAEGRLVLVWASAHARDLASVSGEAVRGFAAQAALALDRLQAQEDRASLAVLEDRDRIARDLHDLVIQRLFATGLALQGAARLSVRPEVVERVEAAIDDLDVTIRDIRATIFSLHRRQGSDDLRGQLLDLVAEAGAKLGLVPALAMEGPLDTTVPASVRPHLVAVLSEALANAARHADATRVDIKVAVRDGEVTVSVQDDGKGLPSTVHESGLRNLRQRAVDVGGSLELRPADGGGTRLIWRAPV